MGCCPSCLVNGQIVVHESQFFSNGAAATPSETDAVRRSRSCRSRRRGTKTQIRGQGFGSSPESDPSESELGCLLWASPRVGAGPADCLGGGAATWAPPSTRRSSQESDVTSIDVAGRVTGGCRRRTTRKVLVEDRARACAVAGAGLRATPHVVEVGGGLDIRNKNRWVCPLIGQWCERGSRASRGRAIEVSWRNL